MSITRNHVSVVVAVQNESSRIEKCLDSIVWADEIIIIDGNSTDNTVELCRKYTDKIFIKDNPKNFDQNKVFGIQKALSEWILIFDADEIMTNALKEEIIEVVSKNQNENGFYISRINYIYGKKWKGKKDYQMRLFRNGTASYAKDNLHSLLNINGEVGFLKNYFNHYTISNLESHYKKINQYTTAEACFEVDDRGVAVSRMNCVWYLLLKPFLIGIRLYLLEQNYKNGVAGIIWSINGGYYCFLKYAKVWEESK